MSRWSYQLPAPSSAPCPLISPLLSSSRSSEISKVHQKHFPSGILLILTNPNPNRRILFPSVKGLGLCEKRTRRKRLQSHTSHFVAVSPRNMCLICLEDVFFVARVLLVDNLRRRGRSRLPLLLAPFHQVKKVRRVPVGVRQRRRRHDSCKYLHENLCCGQLEQRMHL
jgi:hypothetical protein